MSNTKHEDISEKNSLPAIAIYSDQGSIVESTEKDEDQESIREMVVAGKLVTTSDLLLSSLLPRETNTPIPTVTKETATKYKSRPSSAPATPDPMVTVSTPTRAAKEKEDEKPRSSKVKAQGYNVMGKIMDTVTVTSKVTSKVADKVKDVLTGKVTGRITAKSTALPSDLPQPVVEANAAAQASSGGQDNREKQRLSSVDVATLSNPGIPSIILPDASVGAKRRSAFPQPFYSTLGRYIPHGPGDEAFSPITLTMTLNAEEGDPHQSRRPTVTIRTLADEKQASRTRLNPPSTTPGAGGGAGGGGAGGGAGGGLRPEESKHSIVSDTDMETESVLSGAMMRSVVSIMKFFVQTGAQEREAAALASATPATEAESDRAAERRRSVLLPSAPVTEDDLEALRLSVRAMIGLQRWKRKANARISQKAGRQVTIKTFAKNPQHNTLLQKNLEDITTEPPLPLKRTLYGEAFPILNDVFQAYERTLGKTNPLTEQARAKIESMTKFMKMYDEM